MSQDNSTPLSGSNASQVGDLTDVGALKIFVVEDNNDFRELLCEMLQMLGHTVLSEANGEKALDKLGHASVDLLITDVTLPGMSGIELAKKVHASHAEIKIILSSGYGLSLGSHLSFPVAVLSKPYSLNQLIQALQDVMSS